MTWLWDTTHLQHTQQVNKIINSIAIISLLMDKHILPSHRRVQTQKGNKLGWFNFNIWFSIKTVEQPKRILQHFYIFEHKYFSSLSDLYKYYLSHLCFFTLKLSSSFPETEWAHQIIEENKLRLKCTKNQSFTFVTQ